MYLQTIFNEIELKWIVICKFISSSNFWNNFFTQLCRLKMCPLYISKKCTNSTSSFCGIRIFSWWAVFSTAFINWGLSVPRLDICRHQNWSFGLILEKSVYLIVQLSGNSSIWVEKMKETENIIDETLPCHRRWKKSRWFAWISPWMTTSFVLQIKWRTINRPVGFEQRFLFSYH